MKRQLFSPFHKLVSPHEQTADFVELFFDLVFVYAITQITAIMAHHLDVKHVVQSLIILWLIWWAWTLITASLNAANTRIAEVRVIALLATGVAFVMASSIGEAFDSGVMWFAVPYILIRLLGIGLYVIVTTSLNENRAPTRVFTLISSIGFVAILIGCFADPSHRIWWWSAAIVIDMLAVLISGQLEGWHLHPKHFSERHGLIIIIALGESLIVAASAVSGQERSQELIIVGGLAVIVTCLLWWNYFAWIAEHLEEYFSRKTGIDNVKTGRDIYSLIHFLLVAGIIGMAVGFEKILGHPYDEMNTSVAIALGVGYFLFAGFTALAVWRSNRLILLPRLVVLIFSVIAIAFSIGHPPYVALGIVAISLTLISIIEWTKCRHA